MAIHIEVFDHTIDYTNNIIEDTILINDYFNFDYNDIDLNLFSKILREGKESKILIDYKHLPKNLINNNNKYIYEDLLGKHDNIEKIVYEDFKEIYLKISDSFFNLTAYPYYNNSVYDIIKYRFSVYSKDENKEYKEIYFFILLLSKRKTILGKLLEFYKKKFTKNFENGSIVDHQEGLNNLFPKVTTNNNENLSNENSANYQNISNTLTIEILKSPKFVEFCNQLAKWYSLAENITMNLGILNEFFGFNFEFSQEKFSLGKNFDFSLKTFAKKNILKLISYFLKKSTLNINFGEFNYKRLLLIFASAFTCGIPIKDFMFRDIKQFAILGGVFFNIIVGKIANNIENYSNTIEFSRLMTILEKLNKKLTIIEKKLYKILKSSIRSKLLNYIGVEEKTKCIEKLEERKKIFIQLLAKYLKGTENFDEEQEMSLLRESVILSQDIEKSINTGKNIDETWVLLNLKNKDNEDNIHKEGEQINLNHSLISQFNDNFK